MDKPKPKSFIMISGNKAKDLESLEEKITPIVNVYFNQGIYDIHVRLYLCKYKNKYIYTSRAICVGIEKRSNKFIRINKGTNALVEYAVAYWKYDHARAKDIKWNTLILHTDGYELEQPSTDYDEAIENRARLDARDGILDKLGREITNFLYRTFIGSRKPDGMKEEKKSSDSDTDMVSLN